MKNNQIICDFKFCTGCSLCEYICPKSCITMEKNEEGFYFPVIDSIKCINCNNCIRLCPENSNIPKNSAKFYMAINKNQRVLEKSSSGGVFTALANYFFENEGIVFGAYKDSSTREVKHISTKNEKELDKIRLSKYYQSDVGKTYEEVKSYLKEGKKVLFSGTACQIAALYSYLGKKYQNLTTVDVLCHGVTSKYLMDRYVECKEQIYKKKIINYDFRVKNRGKNETNIKFYFHDGSQLVENMDIYNFFFGFNKKIFLRESCYNCKYCGEKRISDFTICDFWGVTGKRANEGMINKGISIICTNTWLASSIFEEIKKNIDFVSVEKEEVIKYNRAFVSPNERPQERDKVFKLLEKYDYNKVINSLFPFERVKEKVKYLIKNFLGTSVYNRMQKAKRKISGHLHIE